jgi:hypothetical protein
MPAPAKGGVNVMTVGLDLERINRFVQQNRSVGGVVHGVASE